MNMKHNYGKTFFILLAMVILIVSITVLAVVLDDSKPKNESHSRSYLDTEWNLDTKANGTHKIRRNTIDVNETIWKKIVQKAWYTDGVKSWRLFYATDGTIIELSTNDEDTEIWEKHKKFDYYNGNWTKNDVHPIAKDTNILIEVK